MYEFLSENGVLKQYNGFGKRVTVPDGIRVISGDAFSGNVNIQWITLGKDVVKIEANAFYNCRGLTKVTMENVAEIGDYAFYNCRNLETLSFGEKLETIGNYAFYGCSSMNITAIPRGVKNIGTDAFYGCMSIRSLAIPDSVERIGKNAFFSCSSLVDVKIGEGIKYIGADAFTSNGGLRFNERKGLLYLGSESNPYVAIVGVDRNSFSVCELHKNTKAIAEKTFNGVKISRLIVPYGIKAISDYAFYGCKIDGDLLIPASVETIGENAFCTARGIASVRIEGGASSIGDYSFSNCSSLTSAVFDDGATYISKSAFDHVVSLTCVDARNNAPTNSRERQIKIGRAAFIRCSRLQKVLLPPSTTSIGDKAFYDDGALTVIRLKADLDVGNNAFYNCGRPIAYFPYISNAKEKFVAAFKWLSGNRNEYDLKETILAYISRNKDKMFDVLAKGGSAAAISSFFNVISPTVLSIEALDRAITESNTDVKSVLLNYKHENYTQDEVEAYENDEIERAFGLKEPTLESLLELYSLKKSDKGYEIVAYKGENIENLKLPDEIEQIPIVAIGEAAFANCESIRYVKIGENVEIIGDNAFAGCKNLSRADLSDGVKVIGEKAFYDCKSLVKVAFGERIQKIGEKAFALCRELKKVFILAESIEIGDGAFFDDRSIEEVIFPKKVKRIGKEAFRGCVYMNKLLLQEGVDYLGEYSFADCTHLKYLELEAGVLVIGGYSFRNCERLNFVSLPKGLTVIEDCAFIGCKDLDCIYYGGRKADWQMIKIRRGPTCKIRCRDGTVFG